MAAELTQIYYRDDQKQHCYPFAKLHYNEGLTMFFENSVIAEVVLRSQAEKIAVCSWKLKEKMRWNVKRPRELTQSVMDSEYDVLSFTGNTKTHGMLYSAKVWHPGFMEGLKKLGDIIKIKIPSEVKEPIYQNHFSAKRQIYQEYIYEYLGPAMKAMKNEPDLNKMVMVDSHYATLQKTDLAEPEYLRLHLGVPFYPLAPFILERLFSIFVHNKKIKVTPL